MILLLMGCWHLVVAQEPPSIRVLLGQQKRIELYLQTPLSIEVSSGERYDSTAPRKLVLQKMGEHWLVDLQEKEGHQNLRLSGAKITLSSQQFWWGNQMLKFPLTIVQRQSLLQLIATMDLETYLMGVIPREMPSSWPKEALKAQVVASRTYALWKIQNQKKENYDVQATVMDQVFQMPAENTNMERVKQAVLETQGQTLRKKNQSLVKTYFHSDCGGATELTEGVWGFSPPNSMEPVEDASCKKRKESQWESRWSVSRLEKILLKEFYLPPDLSLQDLIVRSRFKSHRVDSLDLIFTKGIFKRIKGEDLRRILGYDQLKSTLFEVEQRQGAWVFVGKGHGHGVGMCQWGAKSWAQEGRGYQEILKHYYPMSYLQNEKQMSSLPIQFKVRQ